MSLVSISVQIILMFSFVVFYFVSSADSTNSVAGEVEPTPHGMWSRNRTTYSVVGGAHAFILRISSLFGLAPLRFEPHSNGFTVSLSNGMCIYSYIFITALVLIAIAGFVAEINVGIALSVKMSTTITQVMSGCDILILIVVAAVGVYGAPRRMRIMLKFMDNVATVDTSIGGQYSKAMERKLWAVLLSIFFAVLLFDDLCFYAMQSKRIDREWSVVINNIGFYVLWYVVMILELQFAFTALLIRARFQAVNDALALTDDNLFMPQKKSKNPEEFNIFAIRVAPADSQRANVSLLAESSPKKNVIIVRKSVSGESRLLVSPSLAVYHLSSLYGELCDVVHQIDVNYGIPLILTLMSVLLHQIKSLHRIIMELITLSLQRPHFLVLQFLWCVTHMLRLLIMVEPSHYTISEGKRTETLVCKLMMRSPVSGPLPSRLEIFSRQLMLQSVCYRPIGMCTLDRPLVASILGAVTTYLVILIQFQRYDT